MMERRNERVLRARHLAALREGRKWSNQDLADRLNEKLREAAERRQASPRSITAEGVRRYADPKLTPHQPSLDVMDAIAEVFGVSLDYVLGRTENPDSSVGFGLATRMALSEHAAVERTLDDAFDHYHLLTSDDGVPLGLRVLVKRLRRRWADEGREATSQEAAAALATALQGPLDALGAAPTGDALDEYTALMIQALRAAMRGERPSPTGDNDG